MPAAACRGRDVAFAELWQAQAFAWWSVFLSRVISRGRNGGGRADESRLRNVAAKRNDGRTIMDWPAAWEFAVVARA